MQVDSPLINYWDEVSASCANCIAQLDGVSTKFALYKVCAIHESKILAHIPQVKMGELYALLDEDLQELMYAEVAQIEAGDLVTLFPLGSTAKLSLQCRIRRLHISHTLLMGDYLRGKVLDGFGNIIYQFSETPANVDETTESVVLNDKLTVPVPFDRKLIYKQFVTGVKALDLMIPCGIGQRLVVCAQPGVGKTTLMQLIAGTANIDLVIINLIGERGREVNEFFVSLDDDIKHKTIFVISTADKSNVERVKSLYTSHIIASWFRSRGRNVLLLVDSLTRFARALREVSLANGAMIVRSYTNTVFSALPQILEVAGTSDVGSITGLYTALFEDESLGNDPLIEEVKSITDGHIVLSRKIGNAGRYPAISFLESISRVAQQVTTSRHMELLRKVLAVYSSYAEFELLIRLGEYVEGTNPEIDAVIKQYKQLNIFFNQSKPGDYSDINTVLHDLEAILL